VKRGSDAVTLAQLLFVLALAAVLIAVAGFGFVMISSAARSGGGSFLDIGLIRRLQRPPEERAEFNRWAFYAHRFTGFAVFAFLCLHIVDVSLYAFAPEAYDEVHALYGWTPMRLFECGLLFAILFHTFNGLRILAIDVADLGSRVSRGLLVGAVVLTALLGLGGSAIIMAPVLT
jgi:succinate dehydrogenase / fumarate reductase, cytochrome b subunit